MSLGPGCPAKQAGPGHEIAELSCTVSCLSLVGTHYYISILIRKIFQNFGKKSIELGISHLKSKEILRWPNLIYDRFFAEILKSSGKGSDAIPVQIDLLIIHLPICCKKSFVNNLKNGYDICSSALALKRYLSPSGALYKTSSLYTFIEE